MTERCDGSFGSVLVVAVSSGMITVEQACHLPDGGTAPVL